MKLLITGGCGFLGSNLAGHAIKKGYDVTIFDNLSRIGTTLNLKWLESLGNFNFVHGDIRNKNDVETLIAENKYDAIFHLAGQVAMTTSIINPYKDFEINALGTLNILDSVRKYSKDTCIFYSSTNKVYGDLEDLNYTETSKRYICEDYANGLPENSTLDFHSPYGCSKGTADQYMLDYHRIFGLKTVVFRHSSMYGSHQYSTGDQGWVGWFCKKAVDISKDSSIEKFTISGNGKQVRDILNSEDMISLYFTALENIDKISGEAFNIGGGMNQSLSLLELFDILNENLGIKMEYIQLPVRESDQKVFVADISKIKKYIGWEPKVTSKDGVKSMVEWVKEMKL